MEIFNGAVEILGLTGVQLMSEGALGIEAGNLGFRDSLLGSVVEIGAARMGWVRKVSAPHSARNPTISILSLSILNCGCPRLRHSTLSDKVWIFFLFYGHMCDKCDSFRN